MQRRSFLSLGGVAAASTLLAACGGGSDDNVPSTDIVQAAQATPELSILVEAVVAAGLVDALKAPGPFTVFAPTNAAFASLLTELGVSKEQLLANKPLLTQVLTYHVVPGLVFKANIVFNTPVATLQGQTLRIDSGYVITDQRGRRAAITATDIRVSNGLVHLIDKVILPAA